MASPGSDDGRTPLARPGRDGMAALPHPPPLSLDIRHATPEDFQLREGDDPSPTASSPRSGRRPASAGPETPGALASSAASSASAAIDVRGSLTSLRNRRQSMVPEHLLHARSESPLPDDLQPSDLQARGLRQINFPGSFATQDAFLPKRLLDGSEEGTPLGSRARRRTMIGLSSGSASIDSNHRADHLRESSIDSNRRTNYLREPSIDGMDDDEDGSVFDESRPLLTGTLHSSPKEPFFHDAGPDREGTDFSFPSTTSQRNIPGFAEGNTDIHEMMVEERELRFGIDYDFLATYLADAKEKRDLPPSPKPEVRKRTGSTVPDPRRQRTGSSVFRGLLSPSTEPVVVHHEPPAPAQTVINFYSPGFGAISAPSIGELDFSKYGKTLADVIRDPGGDWFWIDVVNLDAATMRTLARVNLLRAYLLDKLLILLGCLCRSFRFTR